MEVWAEEGNGSNAEPMAPTESSQESQEGGDEEMGRSSRGERLRPSLSPSLPLSHPLSSSLSLPPSLPLSFSLSPSLYFSLFLSISSLLLSLSALRSCPAPSPVEGCREREFIDYKTSMITD